MKKLLLTLTVVAVSAVTMYGQGRIVWNNYSAFSDPNTGAVTVGALNQGASGGSANDFVGGTYSVQLRWAAGTFASQALFEAAIPSVSAIVAFAGGTGTGPAHGPTVDGAGLYDGSGGLAGGVLPVGGPAGTYTFQVQAWFNGGAHATYASSIGFNNGRSALTQLAVTESPNLAPNLNVGGFQVAAVPVPEPSTFALAGLGAASLLLFRRRK